MPQHVLTLEQIENLFFTVTTDITGLEENGQVRIAYAPDGQPAWSISESVVCINVFEADDPWNRLRDITYDTSDDENAEEEVTYTRVMEVLWTVYGPTAYDIADTIRYGILTESARNTLRAEKVYPIPDIAAPVRLNENKDGQWWGRADVRARFNLETTRVREVPYIEAAEVRIYNDEGLQRTVIIEEP